VKKLKKLLINKKIRKLSCVTAAGAGFVALGSQAQAQTVIIQDNFTKGTSYTSLVGLTPDTTNLPGGAYQIVTGVNQNYCMGESLVSGSSYAYFAGGTGGTAGLTLSTYNTGTLQISANMSFGHSNYYGNHAPGTGAIDVLGFASATSSSAYYQMSPKRFTGLALSGVDGSLQEYVNGTAVGSSAAFGGTYSAATPTLLSYQFNTATGAITDVSFGSSTTTYSFATSGSFVNGDSAYVDIGGRGGAAASGTSVANVQNLLVEIPLAVPEPSTDALLVGGALALGALQLRRRNRNS